MASEKQVSANRQNAANSTGPITQNGKLQSRRNAIRHGLTAETVVPAIEDTEEFERFEAAIRADYQPISAVEHELVARLSSLLWRLRRSALIETNLFQLQARLARDRNESDATRPGMEIIYRLLASPQTLVPSLSDSNTPERHNQQSGVQHARKAASPHPNPATIFLRLCNLGSFPIERISRYETALWRQVAQTLFILDACRRRSPSSQPADGIIGP